MVTVIFALVCGAAGRLRVRARGGEPRRAALHEPQGRAGEALAAPAALAVLPLAAARRLHHHVPVLLPGTASCTALKHPQKALSRA